jgi:predicted DNA-binding ArsR family transcriptional regulator
MSDISKGIQKINVIVNCLDNDSKALKAHLSKVLSNAGMNILNELKKSNITENTIYCFINIIGKDHNHDSNSFKLEHPIDNNLWVEKQSAFFVFLWQSASNTEENKIEEEHLLMSIDQTRQTNTFLIKQESAIKFVEDMRSIINPKYITESNWDDSDLFFIYNQIDEDEALEIIDFVRDIIKIRDLSISLNSDKNYEDIIKNQMKSSRLTVVYYNRTINWAQSFVQQIWRNSGGLSSGQNILVIGDHAFNKDQSFDFPAENVDLIIVESKIIPIEIKIRMDNEMKVNE